MEKKQPSDAQNKDRPSRTDEARQVVEEYAAGLREIIEKHSRKLD
jgi:hypothetical protein